MTNDLNKPMKSAQEKNLKQFVINRRKSEKKKKKKKDSIKEMCEKKIMETDFYGRNIHEKN